MITQTDKKENTVAMDRKIDIHKSAGILIQDRKLLIVRSRGKSFFISPGGKIEPNETTQVALVRELKEELNIDVHVSDLSFFGTFFASVIRQEDKYMQMDVFFVSKWKGEITPTSEIEEIKWIDSTTVKDIELGSVFLHDVLPKLKEQNLIN